MADGTRTVELTKLQRRLPLGYLGTAALLIVFLLPTLLRPVQESPTTTAEFSPEAPPQEEEQAIFESLEEPESVSLGAGVDRESSDTGTGPADGEGPGTGGTGGDGGGGGGDGGGGDGPPAPTPGACPFGVGDPPRQIESVYSPPCALPFTGDNGGATYYGVTENEINISFVMDLTGVTCTEGRVPQGNDEGTAEDRTYRVWERYFNERYEFYGRQVRFFCVTGTAGGETDSTAAGRVRARRAHDDYQSFAAIQEFNTGVLEELVRLKMPVFTLAQVPRQYYTERQPYLWSFTPDATGLIDMGAEYVCKRLAQHPPGKGKGPGDVTFDYSKPRRFGILAYADPAYASNLDDMRSALQKTCNLTPAETATYRLEGESAASELSGAMLKMKQAGVTTIIFLGELVGGAPVLTASATSNAYFPEWFIPGFGGVDVAQASARANDRQQWSNAFGFSMYEIPSRDLETECFRAYHEVDPGRDPDADMCKFMWGHVVQLLGGIQLAGPDLTPETFAEGLRKYPSSPPDPPWRMAGGYSGTDFTYPDYAAEIWWDFDAQHPDGQAGAYRYVDNGRRYGAGEWPQSQPRLFQDGITARP